MYQKFINRKERVIISAIDLLDELGVQGFTTKELAKREGISEPAIYRQFYNKHEIILAVLDRYARFDEYIMNTVTEQGIPPKDAVFFYAGSFAGYYESYPQITTVMFSFDVFRYNKETNEKMNGILERRHIFLEDIIKKGQKVGEFDCSISAGHLAEIISGLIWSATFKWKAGNFKKDLKPKVLSALEWVLRD